MSKISQQWWTDEDLTDSTRSDITLKEDDPWAVTVHPADIKERPAAGTPSAQSGNDQPEALYMADCDDTDLSDIGESCDDYLPPLELDDETSDVGWDEPEPSAEADSDLNEPLYPPDNNVRDLSRDRKIDELIFRVQPINDTQRREIVALLKDFSIERLRSWLSWATQRDWSGHSLLLFLQFRKVWESDCNAHWWESLFWHPGLECWWPTCSRDNLTRDATYKLIQNRLDCTPQEVINEDWFEEWKSSALWTREFLSFVSFAVFRAEFGEKWREHVVVEEDDDEFSDNEERQEWMEYAWKVLQGSPEI